jgi:hypothetical protein
MRQQDRELLPADARSCGCEALQRDDGSGQSVGRLEENAHPAMAELFVDDISFPKRQGGVNAHDMPMRDRRGGRRT